MNDVQPNGEPKKIFLSKPVENQTMTNHATTSTVQTKLLKLEQVRIPPRRHMPPVEKCVEEHLSNHKKQRYWNSWEEQYLVELWRRYKDELTSINVPLPVYRKMMVAMRNRNMIVTAQDCRRKINTINSRYKQELLRMESTGCKPEWRLFPLVHCVLQPKIKEYDPWNEHLVIKKLLDKIPKPVEVVPVLSNSNNNNTLNSYSHYQAPQPLNTFIPTHSKIITPLQPRNSHAIPFNSANQPFAMHTDNTSTPYNNRLFPSQNRFEKPSILPFRNITVEKIEQLREDNNRLAEQRDMDLKCLHMEESNFRSFEEFIRKWTEQKENELRRIELMSAQNVICVENDKLQMCIDNEKINVEQQLQDTITAK